MIAILKKSADDQAVEHLVGWIEKKGLTAHVSRGENEIVIGLVGDTSKIDPFLLESMDIVERVQRVSEPFKKANRKFHPADTVVDCGRDASSAAGTSRSSPVRARSRATISCASPAAAKRRAPRCCAAAPTSPAPPLTPTRAWASAASTFCARRARRRACPWSPRSWTRGMWGSSWRRRSTSCRSAPATRRTSRCSRRWGAPGPRSFSSAGWPAPSTSSSWPPSTS